MPETRYLCTTNKAAFKHSKISNKVHLHEETTTLLRNPVISASSGPDGKIYTENHNLSIYIYRLCSAEWEQGMNKNELKFWELMWSQRNIQLLEHWIEFLNSIYQSIFFTRFCIFTSSCLCYTIMVLAPKRPLGMKFIWLW